jgi:hypothetical protein
MIYDFALTRSGPVRSSPDLSWSEIVIIIKIALNGLVDIRFSNLKQITPPVVHYKEVWLTNCHHFLY